MKTSIVVVWAWLVTAFLVSAQTFQAIYHFTGSSSPYAQGQLLLNGDTLYGTTMAGGSASYGDIFKIKTNGASWQIIKSFTPVDANSYTNADGAQPMAGLVIRSNQLFGTTLTGGSGTRGTVFGLNTDGSNYVVLNNFSGINGKNPYVGLTLFDDVLYGATAAGGVSNKGALFRINPNGSDFGLIKSFLASDGILLMGSLTAGGSTLYGTTMNGGASNQGTIYSISTNGDGFTVLKSFSAGDGANPRFGLVLFGQTLYGTTEGNGVMSNSVVYRMNTDGTRYAVIKRFSEPGGPDGTNADGSYVRAGLVMWDGVLFGTTYWGGLHGSGVVFKINPDGTGFAVLKHFPAAAGYNNGNYINSDGMSPLGDLMVADGVLYGTTQSGGSYGCGTIFRLTIPPSPPLYATNGADQLLVWWNDDGLNRTLQMTRDLVSGSWSNVAALNWTNAGSATQIGCRFTNLSKSAATFFRLQ